MKKKQAGHTHVTQQRKATRRKNETSIHKQTEEERKQHNAK